MADPNTPDLAEIERRRLQLEQNVSSLQKLMRFWQVWEAEYEGVKEEVEELHDGPSAEELARISAEFGGEVVKEQEIKELLGLNKDGPRTKEQIIALVSKRIGLGQQNVQSLQKQIQDVEKRLSSLPTVTIPDMQDEGGLPIAEIHEELDEEGNVISGSVSQPGKAASQILDTLRKAGVTDLTESAASESSPKEAAKSPITGTTTEEAPNDASPDIPNESSAAKGTTPPKKAVTFAEDTKPPQEKAKPKPPEPQPNMPKYSMDEVTHRSFTTGNRVLELDENDNVIAALPVISPDETPEEAQQRREMLAYGLSEVGAVVAELDLEEGTGSEWDDDYDDEDDEDEDEDDEKWRSTKSQISGDYHKKMLELEKQLNARMLENAGPNGEMPLIMDMVEDAGARKLVVRNDEEISEAVGQNKPASREAMEKAHKKGVRFAEELDIAPATAASTGNKDTQGTESNTKKPPVAPMAESVLERKPGSSKSLPSKEAPRKTSRFKSTRSGNSNVVSFPPPVQDGRPEPRQPAPPTDRIVANSLVERPQSNSAIAPEPDEFDPARLQQEVAVEYHKMRDRMLQQQGGVLAQTAEDEELNGPLMEQRADGTVRKVSKFRQARLGRMGM